MCDKGLRETFHLDVQRVTDKYQECMLEQLWVFPSNQMAPILPCWSSLEQESIRGVI